MFFNLYSFVSRDLSGTGVLGIAFAGILGMLLIRDARKNRETFQQRTPTSKTDRAR